MTTDDRSRPGSGVVCSIKDLGDGKVRLVLDDVANDKQSTSGAWKHHTLFTWKDYDRTAIEDFKVSEKELAEFGFNLLARLVALRKHPIKSG